MTEPEGSSPLATSRYGDLRSEYNDKSGFYEVIIDASVEGMTLAAQQLQERLTEAAPKVYHRTHLRFHCAPPLRPCLSDMIVRGLFELAFSGYLNTFQFAKQVTEVDDGRTPAYYGDAIQAIVRMLELNDGDEYDAIILAAL